MKEEKVRCIRCKSEVLIKPNIRMRELRRLGWMRVETSESLGSFMLCPHCVHECKRFLAGCEIKML